MLDCRPTTPTPRSILQQYPQYEARMRSVLQNPGYTANLGAVRDARIRLMAALETTTRAKALVTEAESRLQASKEASAPALPPPPTPVTLRDPSAATAPKVTSDTTDDGIAGGTNEAAVVEDSSR